MTSPFSCFTFQLPSVGMMCAFGIGAAYPSIGQGKTERGAFLRPAVFCSPTSGSVKDRQRERSMSAHTPTGFNWAESIQPFGDRRERARTVAAFAEYLAENVHGNSDWALE